MGICLHPMHIWSEPKAQYVWTLIGMLHSEPGAEVCVSCWQAGEGEDGRLKSAIGIGSLLMDGLGDTIRVSLTEDPEYELEPCRSVTIFKTVKLHIAVLLESLCRSCVVACWERRLHSKLVTLSLH